MIRNILKTLSLLVLLNISSYAKTIDDTVDHLGLATLMIYDARYKKAKEELDLVDKKSPKFDVANYHSVLGVLNSKQDKTKEAISEYKKAIEATKTKEFLAPKILNKEKYLFSIGSTKRQESKAPLFDPEAKRQEKISQLYMYLTQEYYKLKDYKNTVNSLERAGDKGKSRAGLYTLRAECYYKQDKHAETFAALNAGIKRISRGFKTTKTEVLLLCRLKTLPSRDRYFKSLHEQGWHQLARVRSTFTNAYRCKRDR